MRQNSAGGYPLTTLFVLVAAAAVVMAMLVPLVRHYNQLGIGANELVSSVIIASLGMLATGATIGMFQSSRALSVCWGALVGALLGFVVGPVIFIPPEMFSIELATASGGAIMLVIISTLISVFSSKTRAQTTGSGTVESRVKQRPHPLDPDPEDEP